jgi:hypothetical protein
MRPYAIYEHPDFSLSAESVSTLQKIAAALTAVAASSAAVYEYIAHVGTRQGRSVALKSICGSVTEFPCSSALL